MSSKKDKFLDSAQKFILKGQIDRAIKDYEQIVALDPGDIRHRQRLAELLVRVDRKEEAIAEYEAIGKYYSTNLYYLKAIAVYKQIQKLDPENIKVSLSLATLNEKQGLTGNALAEYSRVYSYYERLDKRSDALSILESMLAIDPENLNTRLKFAENRFASGGAAAAYEDFTKLALLLRARGDDSAFNQVCERVAYLFPDKPNFMLDLLAVQLKDGDAASVAASLQVIVERNKENFPAWQLLIEALRAAGEIELLKSALQKMLRLFPDELFPKENLIRFAVDNGDAEGAAYLLKLHGAAFLAKGAADSLERLHQDAVERMPNDDRLLQGLRNCYESTGNQAGLAKAIAKIASEPPEQVEHVGPLAVPVDGSEPLSATADAGVDPEVRPFEDDELDISLDMGDMLDSAASLPEAGVPQLPSEQVEVPTEQQEQQEQVVSDEALEHEIDIELDLSEDQLLGAFPLPEPEDAPEACNGITAGEAIVGTPEEEIHETVDEIELDLELPDELLLDAPLPDLDTQPGEAHADADVMAEADVLAEADVMAEAADGIEDLETVESPAEEDSELFTFHDSDFVELEAELAELELDESIAEVAAGPSGLEVPSPSGVRRGIEQQLDKEDTETHYHLGIAFKEMGLFDDAITEFQSASRDPVREVDCIILQGMCCREKGDFGRAEEILKKVLTRKSVGIQDLSPLKYELALLYESSGNSAGALTLYREIYTVAPSFRDTREKLELLQGGEGEACYDDLDLLELEGEIE